MRAAEKPPSLYAGPGKGFSLIFRAALVGFTLGLILAVLASSWIWLEMHVNVGGLIPMITLMCPVFALWKRRVFSYSLFLMGQTFLVIIFLAIYGFDRGALWVVPASLFREGFHFTGLALTTAGFTVGGIFLGGNFLWMFSCRRSK